MILNIKTAMLFPLLIALAVTLKSGLKMELSNYINKSFENGRKLRKFKKALFVPVKKKRKFIEYHSQKIARTWMIFGFVFAVFLGFAFFEKEGKESANKVLDSIKDDSYEVVRVGGDERGRELAYLYCGSRNCAGYDKSREEVVYFPQSGHSYIRNESM
jgi:hypothetical protein